MHDFRKDCRDLPVTSTVWDRTAAGEEWATTRTPAPRRRRRHSSGLALASGWDGTSTTWWQLGRSGQPEAALSRPRLPDWALPKRKPGVTTSQMEMLMRGTNGHMQNKSTASVDLPNLKARVKLLK